MQQLEDATAELLRARATAPAGAATALVFNTMAMSYIATYQANLANFKELKLKYDKNRIYSRYNMTN